MGVSNHPSSEDLAYADAESDLKEVVMGLRWDPMKEGATINPEDLDALCMLLDEQGQVLEVVHPGQPRNANGSVIHTGDSRTGAGDWDDERIFVFLKAIPETVAKLRFHVASTTGRDFGTIHGASCHISDRITEREWVRCELSALGNWAVHCVATLYRSPTGWKIASEMQPDHSGL